MKRISLHLLSAFDISDSGNDRAALLHSLCVPRVLFGFDDKLTKSDLSDRINSADVIRSGSGLLGLLNKAQQLFSKDPDNSNSSEDRYSIIRSIVILSSGESRARPIAPNSRIANLARKLRHERGVDIYSVELFHKAGEDALLTTPLVNLPYDISDKFIKGLLRPQEKRSMYRLIGSLLEHLCPGKMKPLKKLVLAVACMCCFYQMMQI